MGLDGDLARRLAQKRPLARPALTLADMRARRALCRPASLPAIPLAEGTLQLSFEPLPPAAKGGLVLRGTLDGHAIGIKLGWSHVRRLTGETLEIMQRADAALIIEEELAPWLDAVEHATGCAVALTGIEESVHYPDLGRVGLRITKPGFETVFELLASEAAVAALAGQLRAAPQAKASNPAIALSFILFETRWSLARLKTLEVGSGIFVGESETAMSVLAEGQFTAPATRSENAVTLTGAFTALPPLGTRTMTETAGSSDSFDTMEVRLQVRAGEALITLADLRNLAPGAVLSLPGNDGAVVDLMVNDRAVGRGVLVDTPGGRAVEITELF